MEKELQGIPWHEHKAVRVLLTILVIAMFGYLYVHLLSFSADHTKRGNALLAIYTFGGSTAVIMLIRAIHQTNKFLNGTFGKWLVNGILAATVVHIIGVFMADVEYQRICVYAPIVMVATIPIFMFLRWIMESAKLNKQRQI